MNATPIAPLGLRVLCRATGITEDASDINSAYTAALTLAENVTHDCNPTYCAIDKLRATLDPDKHHDESVVLATLKGTPAQDDHYGAVILNVQHASFLLGAAYVFVMMSALSGKDGAR